MMSVIDPGAIFIGGGVIEASETCASGTHPVSAIPRPSAKGKAT